MKTLHIASILALSTALTFACGDDDDNSPIGTAGSSGSAQAGDNGGGDGPDAGGNGGTSAGGTSNQGGSDALAGAGASVGGAAGAGGAPAPTCEFGNYGEGGEGGAAGAVGAGGQASEGFELVGTWQELFMDEPIGTLEITSSFWNSSGIAGYDSEANVVYTQTPCDDMYNPGAFSKIVYTDVADDAFYYCTAAYGLKTLAEAQAAEGIADPEDLEAGCGASGFSWSKVVH